MSVFILTTGALIAIVLPLLTGLFIVMCPQKAARVLAIVAGVIATAATLIIWCGLAASPEEALRVSLVTIGKVEVIGFVFDRISVMLAACFVGIGLLITIYTVGYLNEGNREHPDLPRRRFFAAFIVFIGAMAGIVYSSTLVGMLVFFEVTGICSWLLIGYYGNENSERSALKALILTQIGALGLFIAVGYLFAAAGTFEVSAIASLSDFNKAVLLILILIAAWAKSAQLPFYMWLPSAMVAPTPVSAYLHGASMVKVGVAVMARVLAEAGAIPEVVGWVIVVGALATLLFSFFMYLPQKDMKRLLAFSTISQISYMFLGFGFFVFGSDLAFEGSVMHIFNHAFAKTLFFLIAGAFSYTMGTRMFPRLRGVLRKQPLLGVGFAVAALAIAGAPPLNGFFSKFAIFAGSFEAASGNWLLLAIVVVALIETVACFAWFLKWIGWVLPGEPSDEVAAAAPLPKTMGFVFVVLIIFTVVSSFIAAAWLG
ncbi:MAG: hydrogenase 4 subunit D [Coriobacteriales bacterium]|jgi:hydrogenase-4 component D|nr:hydrogenase 4 subunit D [Coriobacteriales bacterium]